MTPHKRNLILIALGMTFLLGIPALTALAQGFGLNRVMPLAAQEITRTPAPGDGLFLPTTRLSSQSLEPNVIRSRPIEINFGVLAANNTSAANNTAMDSLTFNLFEDAVFTSQKLRQENSTIQSDGYVWVGNVVGDEYGQAILAVGGGLVEGFVQTRDAFYQITYSGGGQVANQIDPARFVSLVDDSVIPPASPEETSLSGGGAVSIAAANIYIIDVMVVYTTEAMTAQGGTTAMQNAITAAVAATNQAYLNSSINQRIRLVHTAEVAYTETGNMNTDLSQVTNGNVANVHSLRNTYSADLVTFITNQAQAGICGLGWLFQPSLNPNFAPYGFNVVKQSCLTGGRTFAHELGHNMGAAHDAANAGSAGAYAYSYGYRDPEGRFRDIMAYSNGCSYPCPTVSYFSNITRKLDGRPIGTTSANNALTLNNTAPAIAALRGGGGSVSPTATPGNPNVSVPPTPAPTGVPGCEITVAASDSVGLINAINTANSTSANVICLTSSVYTFTSGPYSSGYSYGSSALPHIVSNITILGNGASLLRSGASLFRFFYIDYGSLTINGLRMLNGRVADTNAFLVGGAIFNYYGSTLNVANSYFSDNVATYGGAIYNWGSATIKDTIFTGNSAYYGGGLYVRSGLPLLPIERTVFQENSANNGSAIYTQNGGGGTQISIGASCFIRNTGTAVDVDETNPIAVIINADGNWWNSTNGPSLDSGARQAGDVIDAARVNAPSFVTVLPDYCDLPEPFDGSAPSQNYFNTPTQNLTWTRIPTAQSYVIQISDSNTFTNLIVNQPVIGETYPANLGNGFYYWRVAACNAANGTSCGLYSPIESFTVKAP